mgnify:CR=1 FL=1
MNPIDATARANEVQAIKDAVWLEVAFDAMTRVSERSGEEEAVVASVMQMLRGLGKRLGAQVGASEDELST